MENNLKTIVDYVNLALRYLASGLVFVLIWFVLFDKDKIQRFKTATENETLILCAAGVLGVIIYSVHKASFDRKFYKESMLKYIRKNGMPQFMIDAYHLNTHIIDHVKSKISLDKKLEHRGHDKEPDLDANKTDFSSLRTEEQVNANCPFYYRKMVLGQMIFELYTQSFLRAASTNPRVKVIVCKMEDRYAMLAFMYCVFYACIIVSTVHFALLAVPMLIHKDCIQLKDVWQYILFYGVGFFFLFLAQKFSYRLLRREIWIVENYKMELKDAAEEKPKPLNLTGTFSVNNVG